MLYPALAACAYLGLRKGEALGLRWRDVRFEIGNIDVCRSYAKAPKSGKSRQLPISPELAPILREWKQRCPKTPGDLVFPVESKPGTYRAGKRFDQCDINSVYEGAGLEVPRSPWHCLRHTAASWWVMSGVSIYDVSKLLGHSTVTLTEKVYAHLAPSYLAGQVAKLSYKVTVANVVDINTARSTA
jgi:integrase